MGLCSPWLGVGFFGEELVSPISQPGSIPLTFPEVSHLSEPTESTWPVFPPR